MRNKFLKGELEVYYDPLHECDNYVIEFFNSITYLGGRKVACFIRGPMNYKEGRGSHLNTNNKKGMNMGGPSYKTCLKYQSGYANEAGVWEPISLRQLHLRWLTTVLWGSPDALNNMITNAHCEGANSKYKVKTIIQENGCFFFYHALA